MKSVFFFLAIFTILLGSCSKGDCDCTNTYKEDGVITEVSTYSTKEENLNHCERTRGSADTVSGVWKTWVHTCEFTP